MTPLSVPLYIVALAAACSIGAAVGRLHRDRWRIAAASASFGAVGAIGVAYLAIARLWPDATALQWWASVGLTGAQLAIAVAYYRHTRRQAAITKARRRAPPPGPRRRIAQAPGGGRRPGIP